MFRKLPNYIKYIFINVWLLFVYLFIFRLIFFFYVAAMSMNTRSELEEERRLFYVALTRVLFLIFEEKNRIPNIMEDPKVTRSIIVDNSIINKLLNI